MLPDTCTDITGTYFPAANINEPTTLVVLAVIVLNAVHIASLTAFVFVTCICISSPLLGTSTVIILVLFITVVPGSKTPGKDKSETIDPLYDKKLTSSWLPNAVAASRLCPTISIPPGTPSINVSPSNKFSLTVTNNPVDAVSAFTSFSTKRLLPNRSTKSGSKQAVYVALKLTSVSLKNSCNCVSVLSVANFFLNNPCVGSKYC